MELTGPKGQGFQQSLFEKGIQAEATAYVVTKHFGMENKSFNYLILYDADYKKIMENLKAVAEASKEIVGFFERNVAGVQSKA